MTAFHVEATIDLDQNRRVWAQVDADVESADEMAQAALACASAAYALFDKAHQQREERTASRIVERQREREARKTRTFQDGSS